jgi:hypothetical protein
VTAAELGVLLEDLPTTTTPSVEITGTRRPEELRSVFGDIRVAAGAAAPRRAGTASCDVRIDLRGLRTDADRVELHLSTVFGDVEVIVSEGVGAELDGWTLVGDRTTELAPVPRLAGTPRVVVQAGTVFGDPRLRSLAPVTHRAVPSAAAVIPPL